MSSTIQGLFLNGGTPQDGATVQLWTKASFANPGPEYDDAVPGSGQVGSNVTTGNTHGGAGAYRFTAVEEGDYWLSISYGGHIAWEAVHVGPPAELTAPTTVATVGNVATSSTTETDIATQTITAPDVAGQALVIGHFSYYGSVSADVFRIRIYINGTARASVQAQIATSVRAAGCVAAIGPVPASAVTIKMTAQRVSGSGTATFEGTLCGLTWVIIPAADTTA